MFCNNCGTKIEEGDVFCCNCGEKINTAIICGNCGRVLGEGMVFCPYCGKSTINPNSDEMHIQKQLENNENNRQLKKKNNINWKKIISITGIILLILIIVLTIMCVKKKKDTVVVKYSMDEIELELPGEIRRVLKGSKNATYALEYMSAYETAFCSLKTATDEEIKNFVNSYAFDGCDYSLAVVPSDLTLSGAVIGWVYIDELMVEGIHFSQAQGYYWEEFVINDLSVTESLDSWLNVLGTENWVGFNYLGNMVLCWDETPWNLAIAIELNNSNEIESVFIGNSLIKYVETNIESYIPNENTPVKIEGSACVEESAEVESEYDVPPAYVESEEDSKQTMWNNPYSLDEICEMSEADTYCAIHRENEFYIIDFDDRYMWGIDYVDYSMGVQYEFDNVLFAEEHEVNLLPGDEIVFFSNVSSYDDKVEVSIPAYYIEVLPFWINNFSNLCTSSGNVNSYVDYILDKNDLDEIPSGEICDINGNSFDISSNEYLYYAYPDEGMYARFAIRKPEDNSKIQVGFYQGTKYVSHEFEPVLFWSGCDSEEEYYTKQTKDGYTILLDAEQLKKIRLETEKFMIAPGWGIFNLSSY